LEITMQNHIHSDRPDIQLTRRDFSRLDLLTAAPAGGGSRRVVDFLVDELSRAHVVDADRIAPNIVTMHSEVVFRDEESGRERTVTLVYPNEHAAHDAALSVLTPLGAALVGLAEGQTMSFETSDGTARHVTIVKVLSQPKEDGRDAGARAAVGR
jgi:regulator of nucleoside diphosphate kinase